MKKSATDNDNSKTSSQGSQLKSNPPVPAIPDSVVERDAEMLRRLQDREGGSAAISPDGDIEGGLGRHSRENMFRYI